ncbi:G2/mitotic-specific cyclin-A-like [Gigantopelta aegis]|uniref:G2/mitotic-specific cyclin-A-like n=1 Tax=Gigantopelta aegis TaxID=1735272 RepID=UPI001B88BBC5|nr:G2/mitotic-specific cyclin-A-like [Gigantopelta aegis]
MSVVHGTSFQSVSNAENEQFQNGKTTKRDVLTNKGSNALVPKRTALGTITNQIRVQPSRAAKGQSENASAKQKSCCVQLDTFSIFVDEPKENATKPLCASNKSNTALREIQLNKALTSLPSTEEALTSLESVETIADDEDLASPMVLDTTLDTISDKTPLDREAVILDVPEYAEDIFVYLQEAELKNRPKPGYMKKQPDITNSMRSILVDWLVEVSEEYKIHRETLFLAVNYIDRFLSQLSVLRGKLQLVGAASMFLAGKYEEIYPPDVLEFVYITDNTYTKQQVLRMEHLILKVLSFDIAVPTTNWFCERLLKLDEADSKTESLAFYLAELTMIDSDPFLDYVPSVLASSALCLANYTLGREPWSATLERHTGYKLCHFYKCLEDLFKTFNNAPSHPQQAIREKYKASKFHEVSTLSPPVSLALLV